MSKWRWVIISLLIVSVSGNVFLLYTLADLKKADSENLQTPLSSLPAAQPAKGVTTSIGAKAETTANRPATMKVFISQLLAQADYEQARYHLQNALKQQPRDAELLLLEAELLKRTAPLSDVALHYFDMLDMSLAHAVQQKVSVLLHELVNDAINNLSQTESWTALAVFTEPLFQYAPGNRQFTVALATAYAEQQKLGLMEATLAALPPDDPAHNEFASKYYSEPQPDQALTEPGSLPFDESAPRIALLPRGSHYLVPLSVNGNALSLLLDTGASQSALSADVFNRIKNNMSYRFLGNFTISTASGLSQAALIEVESVSLDIFHLKNVKMFVLPDAAKPNADGLLGMNILGQFTFFIDQRMNALHLQKDH